MGITIRDADLEHDREAIISFLRENLTPSSDESRFNWLYLANPHGLARAWIANDDSGRIVGMSGAFPRVFSVAGHARRGWVLGDFCIDSNYRSLGPALKLQRISLEMLAGDEHGFCYDFPSTTMTSIYNRLGMRALGSHVRYLKPLTTAGPVNRFVKYGPLSRCLTRVGDWALGFWHAPRQVSDGIEYSMQECRFGEEFNALASRNSALHPVKSMQGAGYLNWRYVDHPWKKYCAVAARKGSQLVGYGVVEIRGDEGILADLHGDQDRDCLPGILAQIEILMRDMNVCRINAPVLEGCRLVPLLRRAGFYPRESKPVVVYGSSAANWQIDIYQAKNWMLFDGDRDS